jgi:hypothetical protein
LPIDPVRKGVRGGVIERQKSSHGTTGSHGSFFLPANVPAKTPPMGAPSKSIIGNWQSQQYST